jgi:hypothetical protein
MGDALLQRKLRQPVSRGPSGLSTSIPAVAAVAAADASTGQSSPMGDALLNRKLRQARAHDKPAA